MRDPYDTEALRASTLSAWTDSPTRLREDAATEADLVRGGYRDRLLTELAQNAADAAARAGVAGRMRVWVSGRDLHVANTGAPLDLGGVHALTALRVSAKTSGVGRFGVGFTAVRSVSEEIEFRSTAGGVHFSGARTRSVLTDAGLDVPDAGVPVLRLVWPAEEPPAVGFSSEIILRDVEVPGLLDAMRAEAIDLLLELESLVSIEIGEDRFERTIEGEGLETVKVGDLEWWQFRTAHARWLVPVSDGVPTVVTSDVLRAPTRSDEELSLPVLVVADVQMQPDRRRVLPGAHLERVAGGYGEMIASFPARFRTRLVPVPGFPRSEVDGILREQVLRESVSARWLPSVTGENLIPSRAMVLPGLTDELGELLADVFPDLVRAALSGPRHTGALAAVDVHRIGLAGLAEMLTGIDREPRWWGRLYDALTPLVTDGVAAEELAALPVPLSDGRTITGPRTAVLGAGVSGVGSVQWARLVHPDAVSPLLSRLGAVEATATDLLSDTALEALLEDLDWDDSDAVGDTVTSVLALAASAGELPSWIGSLPLEDSDGELRAADELLLPDAPLAGLLVEDSPFGLVADSVVAHYGPAALRAVGVGWGFGTVTDDLPTGPDHDLDEEDSWWASLAEDPAVLTAVRDLDLVDEQRWPDALTQLMSDPATRAAVQARDGYTAWWLRTHARIDGERLGSYRAPSDFTFAGLLDPLDHPNADDVAAALAPGSCDSAWFTGLVLSRLADPSRSPTPAVITRAHRLVADAVTSGRVELDELDAPTKVRAVSGRLVDPPDAIVLDRPWCVAAVPADIAILSSMDTASSLASILDVRTASESIDAEVVGMGRVSSWDREPGAVLACAEMGVELPVGQVVVHRELVVRLSGAVEGEHHLAWWVAVDGTTHCAQSWERPRGR
ncbi:sacsin N-terminal ATP-binding-like domain-containing protein [Rhodococcus sp. 1168]|uniref:sacsin N-terminal ATP-binding-like domain-containing protein n=1 Tax=Rhodococcus sp. 1168 TaxID=2018041 RepID=UPI000A0D81C8|nr:ATP-binding protein [Rhodococcus sp. 1168]ORI26171.1 ATP-binding protein [Rhodococcus sp. 1168]